MKTWVATVLLTLPLTLPAQWDHKLTVGALEQYTTTSFGKFDNDSVILQTNKTSVGPFATFEWWRTGDGIVVGESWTKTNSELFTIDKQLIGEWVLQRYKTDMMYERQFFRNYRVSPFVGVGGFFIILWGGKAPAHSGVNHTGWDAVGGGAVPMGLIVRGTSRVSLKAGVLLDVGRASTYGDTTYVSSQDMLFEPQIGVTWRLP